VGAEAGTGIEDVQGVQQTLSGLSPGRDPGVWTVVLADRPRQSWSYVAEIVCGRPKSRSSSGLIFQSR
jgi:hypothetical protein